MVICSHSPPEAAMSRFILCAFLVALPSWLRADDSKPAPKEFVSKASRFSILFPGTPKEERDAGADGKLQQVQYTLPAADGAYLVSIQDNPGLADATNEKLDDALAKAQEAARKGLNGKNAQSKSLMLDKKYPGRQIEFDFVGPSEGRFRSRAYMVKGRLYQVIVVGKKEFANAVPADRFIDSFKLLP
jgi:predicted RNase H-like HicB family nuclease